MMGMVNLTNASRCFPVIWRTRVTLTPPLDGWWDIAIVNYINMHKNWRLTVSGFLPSRTGQGNGPQVKTGLLLISVNKILCKRSHSHLYATCGFYTVKAKVYSKETAWLSEKPQLFPTRPYRESCWHMSSGLLLPFHSSGLLQCWYVDDSIF